LIDGAFCKFPAEFVAEFVGVLLACEESKDEGLVCLLEGGELFLKVFRVRGDDDGGWGWLGRWFLLWWSWFLLFLEKRLVFVGLLVVRAVGGSKADDGTGCLRLGEEGGVDCGAKRVGEDTQGGGKRTLRCGGGMQDTVTNPHGALHRLAQERAPRLWQGGVGGRGQEHCRNEREHCKRAPGAKSMPSHHRHSVVFVAYHTADEKKKGACG
jgi:hypothetical protein